MKLVTRSSAPAREIESRLVHGPIANFMVINGAIGTPDPKYPLSSVQRDSRVPNPAARVFTLHAGAQVVRISNASRSVFEESPVCPFVSHGRGINAVPVVHNFLLCLVEGEIACANLVVKIVFDLVLIPSTTVRNRRIVGFRP
jgi:hypothetical protein